jgi:TetR/AcrR family fatty acid metabolism transcriptional regulator
VALAAPFLVTGGASTLIAMQDVRTAERGTREMEIIRSAYRTMAKRGSHRMSLQDIADDAGVSKALVLYHFGTKDGLLLSAMKWAVERTAARIRLGVDSGGTPEAQITALVDAIFIDPDANRDFYLFYLDLIEHAGRVPSFGQLSVMLEEIINGLYKDVIADGVDKGVFRVVDVDVAARNMRALIEGTFLQWMQTTDWRAIHGAWKDQCRLALIRLLGVEGA